MHGKSASGQNAITEGVIWKQILFFFYPILLGSLFQQLYNMVDTIVIGKGVGTEGLAAVGSTGSLISLVLGLFVGLASGASVVLAQYYGAGLDEKVSKTVHTAIAMALISGAALTVFGIVTSRPLLVLMDIPDEILDDAALYMQVYYAGVTGNVLYNIETGLLRAIGDTRRPLYALIVSTVINVVLDLLFVMVFHWGVFGVAFATIISQLASALILLWILMRAKDSYRLEFRKLRIHGRILREIIRIGVPSGVEGVVYSISNVLIQTNVNRLGTVVVAAWSAISRVDIVMWMVMQAYGIAVSTFVGQNFGAGKYDRVKRCGRTGLLMTMGSIAAISAAIYAFCPFLLSLFTNDQAVILQGTEFLRVLAPSYCLFVFIEVFSSSARGAGEALQPMLFSILGICGIRVVYLTLILPPVRTARMIAWSYPISWVITAVIFIIYYYRYGWLKRSIRHRELSVE
ncbi:MAG: MATE family efflux transporter [Lachnospiraceae bacterium]|nr:MATE family efflux transporter [Lachnospiraceae bacterium]